MSYFFCPWSSQPPILTATDIKNNLDSAQVGERDAWISALVLVFLALFFTAGASTLYGLGTLSPTSMSGLGLFPYLGGGVLGFLAVGMVLGSFIFIVLSSIRHCQKERWQFQWYTHQAQHIKR